MSHFRRIKSSTIFFFANLVCIVLGSRVQTLFISRWWHCNSILSKETPLPIPTDVSWSTYYYKYLNKIPIYFINIATLKKELITSHIVRIIKSRIMRWAEHVARKGREEACTGFWWKNLKERTHWRYRGVDERVILRRIFRRLGVGVWTGLCWLRTETGGGHLWR
jgi:hypothetical protein